MARFGRCTPCGTDWSFGRSVKLVNAHCPDCAEGLTTRRKADGWPLRFGVEIRPEDSFRVRDSGAELRVVYRPTRNTDYKGRPIKDGIRSPEDIAKRFMPRLRDLPIELFYALYLDGRHNVTHELKVCEGTPTQAVPHVRDILAPALWSDAPAASIAVVHNHPSGNTTPSREDKRFTQALNEGCEALEIKLVDHVIIGDDKFFSFAEAGAI